MIKDARSRGAKKLTLRINSGGGSVFQAVPMRTMLISAGFDEIEIRIEGLCASAATLLTCIPGARILIGEGAMYMIHNPSNYCFGSAGEFEHQAEILRQMERDFHGIYAARSGRSTDEIRAWMDDETWFTAQQAIEFGFADQIIPGEGTQAAAVNQPTLEVMRGLYRRMPPIAASVSNGQPTFHAGQPSGIHAPANTKEDNMDNMDIKDITLEQLKAENAALFEEIALVGAQNERERIQEIEDLTAPGYEQMAAAAKADGTSALDFHKQMVKAQREKGSEFLTQRRQETRPAAQITGGAAEDGRSEQEELQRYAKEMAQLSAGRRSMDGGMY